MRSEGEAPEPPGSNEPFTRRGHHLRVAPDDLRCEYLIPESSGASRRCTRHRARTADGGRERYCPNHTSSERGQRIRARKAAAVAESNRRRGLVGAPDDPVLPEAPTSQEQIALARFRLVDRLQRGSIRPAAAAVVLAALDKMSGHLERFPAGATSAAGGGVLRFLGGAAVAQTDAPAAGRALTLAEMERIRSGIEEDQRKGVAPPADWPGLEARYLMAPRPAAPQRKTAGANG